MEFVLNRKIISIDEFASHTTLLRYIRDDAKLHGTKEGCASGDCGACTVIVGELTHGVVQYTTLNACITPLGAMAGKQVLTVEHLANKDQLHPVQRSFVHCHASQCGFCTPGFIMSAAAHLHHHADDTQPPSREEICEALAGNLCRCTGYRPIIDAVTQARGQPDLKLGDSQQVASLTSIQDSEHNDKTYFRPRNLRQWQACKLRHVNAPLLAGGTDLVLDISVRYRDFNEIIDISNIEELHQFHSTGEHMTLGAGLSYRFLETKLASESPQFIELIKRIGSKQIRQRGTLGGNIANASPIADMPPVLLAFDAVLQLAASSGARRHIPLADFYTGYKTTRLQSDEIIVAIDFPKSALTDFHRFYKISKRYEDDISTVMAAIRFKVNTKGVIDAARIAYGGMAATPLRVSAAENALQGKGMADDQALQAALNEINKALTPLSDVRASGQYRSAMAANLLVKAWKELNGGARVSIFAKTPTTF